MQMSPMAAQKHTHATDVQDNHSIQFYDILHDGVHFNRPFCSLLVFR